MHQEYTDGSVCESADSVQLVFYPLYLGAYALIRMSSEACTHAEWSYMLQTVLIEPLIDPLATVTTVPSTKTNADAGYSESWYPSEIDQFLRFWATNTCEKKNK